MAPPSTTTTLLSSLDPYNVTLPAAASSRSSSSTLGEEVISPVEFTIRSLRHEEDVKSWSEFCAFCFSYKANPPPSSYFARHFFNDPQRDLDLVRVATVALDSNDKSPNDAAASSSGILTISDHRREQIVSSVRIFRRLVSLGDGGERCKAGGIGEVCTHVDYRKRGLANCLLQDALRIMSLPKTDISASLLHSALNFQTVYQRAANYQAVTTPWSVLSVDTSRLVQGSTHGLSVRVAQFPQDTAQLQKLHEAYSERRFCGCIIRSTEYWNDYLSLELGDSLLVCLQEETIVGWISVRPRGGHYQVREFGRDLVSSNTNTTTTTAAVVLGTLLRASLQQVLDVDLASSNVVTVTIPTPVWDELKAEGLQECSHKFWKEEEDPERDDDVGWMYRIVTSPSSLATPPPCMVNLVETQGRPHVIWPSDSF